MIIAYGILILSILLIIILLYGFVNLSAEEVKEKNIGLSILFWFFIALFSAQYIWIGY